MGFGRTTKYIQVSPRDLKHNINSDNEDATMIKSWDLAVEEASAKYDEQIVFTHYLS